MNKNQIQILIIIHESSDLHIVRNIAERAIMLINYRVIFHFRFQIHFNEKQIKTFCERIRCIYKLIVRFLKIRQSSNIAFVITRNCIFRAFHEP